MRRLTNLGDKVSCDLAGKIPAVEVVDLPGLHLSQLCHGRHLLHPSPFSPWDRDNGLCREPCAAIKVKCVYGLLAAWGATVSGDRKNCSLWTRPLRTRDISQSSSWRRHPVEPSKLQFILHVCCGAKP
jgi:hypothetical protein